MLFNSLFKFYAPLLAKKLKIKTKKFLIAGIVLIGGSLSYLIIWLLITILFKK